MKLIRETALSEMGMSVGQYSLFGSLFFGVIALMRVIDLYLSSRLELAETASYFWGYWSGFILLASPLLFVYGAFAKLGEWEENRFLETVSVFGRGAAWISIPWLTAGAISLGLLTASLENLDVDYWPEIQIDEALVDLKFPSEEGGDLLLTVSFEFLENIPKISILNESSLPSPTCGAFRHREIVLRVLSFFSSSFFFLIVVFVGFSISSLKQPWLFHLAPVSLWMVWEITEKITAQVVENPDHIFLQAELISFVVFSLAALFLLLIANTTGRVKSSRF
jgi:hypothetical protein